MALYLAFDVGGTKTAALVADENQVLARTTAGSIKTLRVPPEEAMANLQALLAALKAASGRTLHGNVACTCIGTSGISAPVVRDWLLSSFREVVGGETVLLGDEVIALDAAFQGARGVLAIAGTGSNMVGRARSGAMVHAGGWGPALSDEGSGHWIGTEALRACFRAIDAAKPSSADAVSPHGVPIPITREHLPSLLQRFLETLELRDLEDIIGAANSLTFHSAALVPATVAAARSGDALAGAVLQRAGEDAAALVAAVIRKVEALEAADRVPFRAPEVAFVGGILSHIAEVRDAMHRSLAAEFPGIVLQQSAVDPLEGALWHARGRPGTHGGAPLDAPALHRRV
ncbi:BadF/BadG/BcrA/BcrD ATPase family protein [Acidipila sp. EB88]|uniref:BadF/BadG/BcrA/BcrD ATPase family protein n=1 Tax=Acidipila sp. EB88 TaxID=2305226 RepID=UPI00131573E1|nr:BadF/BadG/BcrA/BcrD ATPase family protein [Acidipila sp. EB88]